MNSVAFRTLGCKQNQFDTQTLRCYLLRRGFTETADPACADWLILNSCAVTVRAMAKARGAVNRLRCLNPGAKIAVLGCGARYQPEQFRAADYVGELPAEFAFSRQDPAFCGVDIISELCPPHGFLPEGRSRALLRIQSGCDQFCSFCIVPHLRGASQSVPVDECIAALKLLAADRVPEIVLTGTNIALWGRDLENGQGLADLLAALVDHLGDARLRLSSLEPHLVSADLLEWCAEHPQVCNHFHLAVQSGSERILQAMGREPPGEAFYRYLTDLEKRRPDISLGADVLAGFPGETERDFEATMDLLESVPFSYLHVFPFCERPGTGAPDLAGVVPVSERLERTRRLRDLDGQLRRRFAGINRGTTQEIVTIKNRRINSIEGLTSNYLRVAFGPDFAPPKTRFKSIVPASSLTDNRQ